MWLDSRLRNEGPESQVSGGAGVGGGVLVVELGEGALTRKRARNVRLRDKGWRLGLGNWIAN